VIFAGRFAVSTLPSAPWPARRDLVGAAERHPEGVSLVRYSVKIASGRSMQQTQFDRTRVRYVRYYDALAQRAEPRLYGHGELFRYLGGLYRDALPKTGRPTRPAGSTAGATGPAGATESVTSGDGTPIAFQRWGAGRPIILVGGALNDRGTFEPLARRLAARFTAYTYDRRGRGGSGDTPPDAVDREVEDLAALARVAGAPAYVLGVSSGAVLAAEAVARGVPAAGLVLIKPPFIVDDTRSPMPADLTAQLDQLVAAGRRGDAVELFLITAVQMPAEVLAPLRAAPLWQEFEAAAGTLAYDLAVMSDFSLPPHWTTALTLPTLVIAGGGERAVAAACRAGGGRHAAGCPPADPGGEPPRRRSRRAGPRPGGLRRRRLAVPTATGGGRGWPRPGLIE
jgi:alpha-beta hydrolase superfamily lysophospholipase